MNDPIDRVIAEREAMDAGLPTTLVLSAFGHSVLIAGALVAPFFFPEPPPIQIMPGFLVMPKGGGGVPVTEPPALAPPEAAPPATEAPQPKPKDEPKVAKPPKDDKKRGLPELDPKKTKKPKPEKTPPPRPARSGGVQGGTGKATQTPGLAFAAAGPGTPDGMDVGGDWYLASVQQKIWMIWTQQIKANFTQPIGVTFTILADGSLEDVKLTQPSGVTLLDLAAQRAVDSASPFGPLPKNYGTNRYTIHAVFQPTP